MDSIEPKHNLDNKNCERKDLAPHASNTQSSLARADNRCKCCHHKTPWWKVALEVATLFVAGYAAWQATRYARIAYDTWEQVRRQADDAYLSQHRPVVWVKMLDNFQIEVGKPLSANIQVLNYGKVPTLVRARISIEASTTIMGRLRNGPHPFPEGTRDQPGILTVLLAPNEQTSRFPIEPRKVLSLDEYQRIQKGILDVAVVLPANLDSQGLVF